MVIGPKLTSDQSLYGVIYGRLTYKADKNSINPKGDILFLIYYHYQTMAPVTALLFCYRLPDVSQTRFKTYIEQTHVPLVDSLLGPDRPLSHTRYYTNKDSGFTIGSASSTDADLVAVITYESTEAMERSMRLRMSDGIREQIQSDEDKFMDRSKVQVVVLGQGDIGRSVKER